MPALLLLRVSKLVQKYMPPTWRTYSFTITKAQQKIAYNIRRLESGVSDKDLFKKIDDSGIWELRTLNNGICYRLFAFWDTTTQTLVVVSHGIVKKSQKTPRKEIDKALAIKNDYFNNKR